MLLTVYAHAHKQRGTRNLNYVSSLEHTLETKASKLLAESDSKIRYSITTIRILFLSHKRSEKTEQSCCCSLTRFTTSDMNNQHYSRNVKVFGEMRETKRGNPAENRRYKEVQATLRILMAQGLNTTFHFRTCRCYLVLNSLITPRASQAHKQTKD